MAHDYAANAAMADRMIAKFGNPTEMTLTRKTVTQDPLTDIITTTTATGTFTAVALDFFTYDKQNRAELIGKESKKLLVSALSCTMVPKVNDEVLYDGSTWTVAAINELNPAGTAIIYTLAIVK